MERVDVVIAGGGPAGLALAEPLARRGFDVLVCERNAEIGVPVRTSGGSWPDDLRRLGLPDRLWHPITTLSFRSQHSRAVVEWGGPVGCSLDVTGTWKYLAGRAEAAGARVETGTLVRPVETGVLSLRRNGESRQVACRLAVDASGTPSLLARHAGVHPGFARVGVGYEEELSAPRFPQHEAMILVGGVAPAGYAWAFPRGDTRVRVGVGVIQPDVPDNPRALYGPVEHALRGSLEGSRVLELHSGRIPSASPPPHLTADGLLVLGDAAAQSNPLLGEGIRHVIEAARRAAPIAVAGLGRPGLVTRDRIAAWERTGCRSRGRAWPLALRANHYVARLDDEGWDRAVELISRLPAEVVTPILRADLLGLPFLLATARRGPRLAWRVARPFLLGG